MKLTNKLILLTGASGGIGEAIAHRLTKSGARVILVGRSAEKLQHLAASLDLHARGGFVLQADLTTHGGREKIRTALIALQQPLDVLINCAGVSQFNFLSDSDPAAIENLVATNITAPILLTRLVMPFLNQQEAKIINVGSTFGALGYPGFSVYCASKFALRGFNEALRRELADTPIQLGYLAPRATRTKLNTDSICAMNRDLGNAMDEPEMVAMKLQKMLMAKHIRDCSLGFPENIFLWINRIFPRLIDFVLRYQLPIIRRYATPAESAANPAVLPQAKPV